MSSGWTRQLMAGDFNINRACKIGSPNIREINGIITSFGLSGTTHDFTRNSNFKWFYSGIDNILESPWNWLVYIWLEDLNTLATIVVNICSKSAKCLLKKFPGTWFSNYLKIVIENLLSVKLTADTSILP